MPSPLSELSHRIARAARLTIITGAGVSAASGIPTFRGAGGLWKSFKPEDLATADAFRRNPALVWEWYRWRRGLVAAATPNVAHEILARWTRERPHTTLITQNVDGLHERAGAVNVLHLHGSLWTLKCWDACDAGAAGWSDDRVPLPELPPSCPHCGALARPGVVWFGESLDPDILARADAACDCDVFLSIGTSSVVHPAAGLAATAKRRGAFVVEINPDVTEVSRSVDLAIKERAEVALPQLA